MLRFIIWIFPSCSIFLEQSNNIEWVFLKHTLVGNCVREAASSDYWARERFCRWVNRKYLNAKHLTIVHISIPLYSIFPKRGFFFWLLFLFQRFVESTFFCRMYKYIIFVIVIIIILDNPMAVFIYFFIIFSFFISVSVVPSPVRCKFFVLSFFALELSSWAESIPEKWQTKGMHVTLPNLCPLG